LLNSFTINQKVKGEKTKSFGRCRRQQRVPNH